MMYLIKKKYYVWLILFLIILGISGIMIFCYLGNNASRSKSQSEYFQDDQLLFHETSNGVKVHIGHLWSTSSPITIPIPISRIGANASEIVEMKSTCGCTVPKRPQKQQGKNVLLISYNPHGRSGPIHESVILRLNDSSNLSKRIDIYGEVIPGWYARPPAIEVRKVEPHKKCVFFCELQIQYDLPEINVESCIVSPACLGLQLYPIVKKDERKVVVNGEIVGAEVPRLYKGIMEVKLGPGKTQVLHVPIEIYHVGKVRSEPENIILDGQNANPVPVRCLFMENIPQKILRIEKSKFLDVQMEKKNDKYILTVRPELKYYSSFVNKIKNENIRVYFEGISEPLLIRVMCFP